MQYFLEAQNGPLMGSQFPVGRRVIIGRDPDVDIQLVQTGVSRQHAAVLADDFGQYFVMDLASKNGTFLAGVSVGREQLRVGDSFRVGETDFILRHGALASLAPLEAEARSVRLASGPAVGPTVDGQMLSPEDLESLKRLKDF